MGVKYKNRDKELTNTIKQTNPQTKEKIANGTRDSEIEDLEQEIEKQKRIKNLEKGKESGIDATEVLAIETAQKAYEYALEQEKKLREDIKKISKSIEQQMYEEKAKHKIDLFQKIGEKINRDSRAKLKIVGGKK